jgi:hypothetical protein
MANTYTLISSNIVGVSGASSVSFSSIPATYTDLKLLISARDNRNDVEVSNIYFNFNSAGAGTNFSGRYIYGTGSSVVSSTTGISSGLASFATGIINTTSTFGNAEVYISNYSSTTLNKVLSSDASTENNGTAGFNLMLSGLYSSTSAISSIEMTPLNTPFLQYSSFYLYGIKNS